MFCFIYSTTVKHIQAHLPNKSHTLWDQRSQADYIVLIGWRSSVADLVPGNVINSLKDALYKVQLSYQIHSIWVDFVFSYPPKN